jgi:hypothetical protein
LDSGFAASIKPDPLHGGRHNTEKLSLRHLRALKSFYAFPECRVCLQEFTHADKGFDNEDVNLYRSFTLEND